MTKTTSQRLLDIAHKGQFFLGKQDGRAYVGLNFRAAHRDVLPIRSPQFRDHVLGIYHDEYDSAPSASTWRAVRLTLEGAADRNPFGPQQVETRYGGTRQRAALDLGNDNREVVEITPQGWEIKDSERYSFVRHRHTLQTLPQPDRSNPKAFAQLQTALGLPLQAWTAILAWLIAALNPKGPYPILHIRGPQASGKSTLARILQTLLGTDRIHVIDSPKKPKPDLDPSRPTILTGMRLPVDLEHRAIAVELPQLTHQRTQAALEQAVTRLHAAVLGQLCNNVSTALANLERTFENSYPRLANSAAWVEAADPTLLPAVLKGAHDPSPVEIALDQYFGTTREWTGTATELRDTLGPFLLTNLPAPQSLSHEIRKLAAYEVETKRLPKTGRRITIRKRSSPPVELASACGPGDPLPINPISPPTPTHGPTSPRSHDVAHARMHAASPRPRRLGVTHWKHLCFPITHPKPADALPIACGLASRRYAAFSSLATAMPPSRIVSCLGGAWLAQLDAPI